LFGKAQISKIMSWFKRKAMNEQDLKNEETLNEEEKIKVEDKRRFNTQSERDGGEADSKTEAKN
jgi:hypothetical protein